MLPVTAVIETGNHIAQAKTGNRRGAAERLVALLRAAAAERPPFQANRLAWEAATIAALCAGNATARTMVDLIGSGQTGAGDVAILVERDALVADSALGRERAGLWTLEAVLGSYS